MKDLPEGLVYVLVVGAILLFQYLMKRFGPQPQPPSPLDEPDPQLQEQATPESSPVSAASHLVFGRSASAGGSAALVQRRFSRRSLLGTRREVQNAIVIATIMGPCRAFEPHDTR